MRILGITLFLMFVLVPVSLFAQGGGGNTGGGNSTSSEVTTTFGESYQGVENLSATGGFIGGGSPDAFVGTTEIYNGSSASSRSASRSSTSARTATTTRRTTTTAQRRTGTTTGSSQLGGTSNQTIRSITSLGSDLAVPSIQRPSPTATTYLTRLHGIQDSRVSLSTSPTGTTAVLTGTVTSGEERRIAQQLLLLEPGINQVENLLEIR